MTLLGVIAWLVGGLKFLTLVARLTLLRATEIYLILIGIGASVPFGPWNMGVVWVVMRSWRITNREATAGLALYGIVDQLSRLALPIIATVLLFAAGGLNGIFDRAGLVTAISLIAFVVVTGVIVAVVRSERAADWLGGTGQRIADSISRRLGRAESANVSGAIHRFRDQLGEVIHRRGALSLFVSILFQLTWAGVLIASLRVMGVDNRTLSPVEIFAVFAMVQVITILPISPGGAGVPELLYIGGLTAIAGENFEAADHGRCVPLPHLQLVPADPVGLDPAEGDSPGNVRVADDVRDQELRTRRRCLTRRRRRRRPRACSACSSRPSPSGCCSTSSAGRRRSSRPWASASS